MFKVFLFLLVLTLILPACREESFHVPQREIPTSLLVQEQAQRAGQVLFLRHCRECHGTFREGRNQRAERFVPPAPDFREQHYAQADPEYLYWRIEKGKRVEPFRSRGSVMPSWQPHLTEEQIWQLVAYLIHRGNSGH